MRLRDVELGDVEAYTRMRCDPAMMAELGGPLPAETIPDKVARDVETVAANEGWIKMIVTNEDEVAGSVVLWSHEEDGRLISEMGWMVLPEHQGRGVATWAAGALLALARKDGRWGPVHAFPGVENGASNGVCRSLGFRLLEECDVVFAGRTLRTNHWVAE
ncbi:GNAT family N-acetyltransferase [Streptacidiphilus neutrinimicus]|uniref:GNAT family N-acetyltransferase n=1 Tax=Streptacidiphilus neutrinimicus TaxID=105420 RepID=UPI0005A7A7B9|nr:GNAT family N-acetyltransferase [Streptacidiphilus neutrinimicus]